MKIFRRDFLKKAGTLSVSGFLPFKAFSFEEDIGNPKTDASDSFLIKDAQVISMDPEIGNFGRASVLVENGFIKTISRNVQIPHDIHVIEGEGAILMPGLIDNHWHLWTSLLRSMAGNEKEKGYFQMTERFSKLYTPEDMKLAARFAAAEAINSGITCVNDFNHNARSPEFVMASFEGIAEAGLKGRVAYGGYRDLAPDTPTDFEGIKQVLEITSNNDKYKDIALGLGARSVDSPFLKEDWERARELGMPIDIHVNQRGQIEQLYNKGLLDNDVNIIHANKVTDEEIEKIASTGASVTMTPFTEMRIGFGFPQINRFRKSKVRLGVGVDTTALSGNANLFAVIKVLQNIANAEAKNEFEILPEEILKMVTTDAAKIQKIQDKTGSITPGKRADLIMLRKNDLNFSTGNRPYHLMTEAAQPANIEFVAIGGKIAKRDGELLNIDKDELVMQAKETFNRFTSQL
ncbi:amidohydrolase family protein [Autumnicola musiva]|uniref:Amidohydrolase family protein n=1 Tax=Autumnicola musiva TaxID=3075589 RepID=A0ABU3D5Z2_9FLAO|nr:amidohydrolase family protein [Zunongwangia sp. F117]MDT0676957.1 amidohydrolase family protein [Zunongwangia sp. F117]